MARSIAKLAASLPITTRSRSAQGDRQRQRCRGRDRSGDDQGESGDRRHAGADARDRQTCDRRGCRPKWPMPSPMCRWAITRRSPSLLTQKCSRASRRPMPTFSIRWPRRRIRSISSCIPSVGRSPSPTLPGISPVTWSARGEAGMVDFALAALVRAFGSDLRKRVRKAVTTHWSSDVFINGAYSCAKPGHGDSRHALRASCPGANLPGRRACAPFLPGDGPRRLRDRRAGGGAGACRAGPA